jgi:hypothetical protein
MTRPLFAFGQFEQGECSQVILFAVIGRAGVGDLVMEECFDRSPKAPGEGGA